jgi:hypothetical protein
MIRAIVKTGQYTDPQAEQLLSDVLIQRRDKIAHAYLKAINPVVNPRLDASNILSFENVAVSFGFAEAPTVYRAAWARFDNATGVTRPIGQTRSSTTTMPAPASLPSEADSFIEVDISAESPTHSAWGEPVRIFFRRTTAGWKLVGLERLP